MKNSKFIIMSFMIAISVILGCDSVSARTPNVNLSDLPVYNDYINYFDSYFADDSSPDNVVCSYTGTDIYCLVGNSAFAPYFLYSSNYVNDYNVNGFYLGSYPFTWQSNNNATYKAQGIFKWNGNSFDTLCDTGLNNCTYSYSYTSDTFITFFKSYKGNVLYPRSKYTGSWADVIDYQSIYYFGYDFPLEFTYFDNKFYLNDDNKVINLVKVAIESDVDPLNYNFKYQFGTDVVTFVPDCTTYANRYYCVTDIPLSFNGDLTINVYDNDVSVYSYTHSAYIDSLPSNNYFAVYDLFPYDIINISYFDTGVFALSDNLKDSQGLYYSIYVVDSSDDSKVDFFSSSYYTGQSNSNGMDYYNFNFNGNFDLYFLITLNTKKLDVMNGLYFLYSPKLAYTHLSMTYICYDDSSVCGYDPDYDNYDPEDYQQSYIDSNGDTHFVDNTPIYNDDAGANFGNSLIKYISYFGNSFSVIGNSYNSFINNCPLPLLYFIYISFGFMAVTIVLKMWL